MVEMKNFPFRFTTVNLSMSVTRIRRHLLEDLKTAKRSSRYGSCMSRQGRHSIQFNFLMERFLQRLKKKTSKQNLIKQRKFLG